MNNYRRQLQKIITIEVIQQMNNKTDEIEYTKEVLYKRNNSAANKTDELNIQKSG